MEKPEPLEENPTVHSLSPDVTSMIKGGWSRGSAKEFWGHLSNIKVYRLALRLLPSKQWDIIFQRLGRQDPLGLIMPAEARSGRTPPSPSGEHKAPENTVLFPRAKKTSPEGGS